MACSTKKSSKTWGGLLYCNTTLEEETLRMHVYAKQFLEIMYNLALKISADKLEYRHCLGEETSHDETQKH